MPFRGPWQSQYVQYNLGDVVEYQGEHYEILQSHASQGDWNPSVTPSLWRRADSSNHQLQQPQHYPPAYNQPDSTGGVYNYHGFETKPEGGYVAPDGQQVSLEETKKPWYDITGDTKKQLLAAGGLAVGLGLVGGALYYKRHEKKEEEESQAEAWYLQNWLLNAKKRSEDFIRDGPTGPVTWILSDVFLEHHHRLARDLVQAGYEDGRPWFIGRAPYNGTLQVGKCRLDNDGALGYIGFGGEAIEVKKFEVLIGDPRATEWFPFRGPFNSNNIRSRPIVGGRDADEADIYVVRITYNGGVHPGKITQSFNEGGYFCYGSEEKLGKEYEVLCLR